MVQAVAEQTKSGNDTLLAFQTDDILYIVQKKDGMFEWRQTCVT